MNDGPHYHGALRSSVAGRTDHLPVQVSSGAYVLPADIVSSLGEGNTEAGYRKIEALLVNKTKNNGELGHKIPIMAAGGEYILPPDAVCRIGGGDLDHGHRILDAFVKLQREHTIKTLKKLPGPAKK